MTTFDPRADPDALSISVGDPFNTLAAMLRVLADGADGGYVISYASSEQEPIDLIVVDIARDPENDDTLPFIVGRLWRDGKAPAVEQITLPVAEAAIHIY